MNDMTFSPEANEMHALAAEFDEQREVNEELDARKREDAQEQAEARRDADDNARFALDYGSLDSRESRPWAHSVLTGGE